MFLVFSFYSVSSVHLIPSIPLLFPIFVLLDLCLLSFQWSRLVIFPNLYSFQSSCSLFYYFSLPVKYFSLLPSSLFKSFVFPIASTYSISSWSLLPLTLLLFLLFRPSYCLYSAPSFLTCTPSYLAGPCPLSSVHSIRPIVLFPSCRPFLALSSCTAASPRVFCGN